jgi:uncharacterized protein involved in exopolysaccharide biosynthesis
VEGQEAQITDEEYIDLRDIIATWKRQKWLILTCMIITTVVGLLYAILSTPLYTASVVVRPLGGEEADGLSDLSKQFGGVAALAGIDLGGGNSDKAEYLAILRSRAFGERFIEEQNIAPVLFPDRWDADASEWLHDESGLVSHLARWMSETLAALSGDEGQRERSATPTAWESYKVFDEDVRSISEDAENGLVTISFKTRNPELAAQWANDYVAMANMTIRDAVVLEASKALEYLNAEVQKASVSGLREALFGVIESQLKKVMFANARPEYAFKVIDRAVVPEEKSHPKRALIIVLAFILGGIMGVVGALALEGYRGLLGGRPDK